VLVSYAEVRRPLTTNNNGVALCFRILGFVPLLTAPFSVVGSSLLIYVILVERKESFKSVYSRLILGLCTLDVLLSLSLIVMGPWAMPEEASSFVAGARGTFQSCEVAGFFLNFMFGTMWYSTFLALYFMLLIFFEWKEATIARYVEPLGHFISVLFPLFLSSVAIANDYINPMDILPGFCWLWHYPSDCHDYEEVECLRDGDQFMALFGPVPMFQFLTIAIAMILITLKVCKRELRSQSYAGGSSNRLQRTKETGKQALYYIGAFFLTFFPMIMMQVLYDYRYRGFYFWLAVLGKFFTPLQGFFNAFIYLRKRYRELTDPGHSLAFLRTVSETVFRTDGGSHSQFDPSLQQGIEVDCEPIVELTRTQNTPSVKEARNLYRSG
jgi:hypothetical protein